jgi:methyltransferase
MVSARVAVTGLAVQRLVELRHARRNTAALRARGATEFGAGHFPFIVALHALWLGATLVEARRHTPIRVPAALTFIGAQALRAWAIRTLGPQWTTRILVDPGAAPVTDGPYRFLRHPNYLAVTLEIASFPLLLGAPRTAGVASVTNAVLLRHRIRIEDEARRDSALSARPGTADR